jgi:hypothetical protein
MLRIASSGLPLMGYAWPSIHPNARNNNLVAINQPNLIDALLL